MIITDLMAALEASGVELLANYLFVLKVVVVVLAALMLVSGLDDLVIDIVYWIRRAWRAVTVYPPLQADGRERARAADKNARWPSWCRPGTRPVSSDTMAELAASTLDYENYHIFVGTYPNDPDTQSDVDEVCARFPNVHKVVCARPGPTSKADCLNNVLDAILQFERIAQLQFAGFILHDAEDVVCKEELRLFNFLVERKDLIQLPVYPFARRLVRLHQRALHGRIRRVAWQGHSVREAIAGQVPERRRRHLLQPPSRHGLLADGDGDRLRCPEPDRGLRHRVPAEGQGHDRDFGVPGPVPGDRRALVRPKPRSQLICVREYFPDTASHAQFGRSRDGSSASSIRGTEDASTGPAIGA